MNEKYKLIDIKFKVTVLHFVQIIDDFKIWKILSNRYTMFNFPKYTTEYIGCYTRVGICNNDIQKLCFALVIENLIITCI